MKMIDVEIQLDRYKYIGMDIDRYIDIDMDIHRQI